tara:strand:+ start:183 stop:572 length:390 start_codon:yes stop_codon:yes gene_type:complete
MINKMINKEKIQKWVDALRSGVYKQGRRSLCKDEGHCCLGVLCEIAMKDGAAIKKEKSDDKVYFNKHSAMPPTEAYQWLFYNKVDKDSIDKILRYQLKALGSTRLDLLNDSERYTFDQIADVLEEQHLS